MVEARTAIPTRATWSVGDLIGTVAVMLQSGFPACTVRGEISGFMRAGSGHCYFNLKDPDTGATLRCAMFRRAAQLSGFDAREGDAVELRGRLAVYEPRGELQFVVESMQRSGAGALYERFLRLRAKLDAEGLFDARSKRALPAFPVRIGIVTSMAGAALHDVTTTLARRSPHVQVVVYPSIVQGTDAPAALCDAVQLAGSRAEVDVLVVCRGGGSLEDLWAFNEECVVRAIRAAPMPVVSGVGHETDVTLADLAADVRAATPTAAAELVAPQTADVLDVLSALDAAMSRRLHALLDGHTQRLDRNALRLARPGDLLHRRAHILDLLSRRLGGALQRSTGSSRTRLDVASARHGSALALVATRLARRLDAAAARLVAVDPHRVLSRGYALLTDTAGRPIVSVTRLAEHQSLLATLADGQAEMTAGAVRPTTPGAAPVR